MNRLTARSPIRVPCLIPCSTALRKWNPTRMRESPFSSAASVKLVYERVTDDSRCICSRRQRHAAVLEADLIGAEELPQDLGCHAPLDAVSRVVVGIGGVCTNGDQVASPSVFGLPSVAANWIAVTGRQKFSSYLVSNVPT